MLQADPEAAWGAPRPARLLSFADLDALRGDPRLRLFACSGAVSHREDGTARLVPDRSVYDRGHLPGADLLDVAHELADPSSPLMATLPPPDRFAEVMGRHGVGPGARVVLYSDGRPSWATRVWWLLRYHGFDDVALLNGSAATWAATGRPLSTQSVTYPPTTFEPHILPSLLATTADVERIVQIGNEALVCVLSNEQFRGDGSHHYGRRGHIPTSTGLPYLRLLDERGEVFRPPSEIRAELEHAGLLSDRPVIAYCGGGIGATALAFALSLVGREAAVYDGSLEAWARTQNPMSRH